jgi:hypothetical protein
MCVCAYVCVRLGVCVCVCVCVSGSFANLQREGEGEWDAEGVDAMALQPIKGLIHGTDRRAHQHVHTVVPAHENRRIRVVNDICESLAVRRAMPDLSLVVAHGSVCRVLEDYVPEP